MPSSTGSAGSGSVQPRAQAKTDVIAIVRSYGPGQGGTGPCTTPASSCVVTFEASVGDGTRDCSFEWSVDNKPKGNGHSLTTCLPAGTREIAVKATDGNDTTTTGIVSVDVERDNDLWVNMTKVTVDLIDMNRLPLRRKVKWEHSQKNEILKGAFEEELTAIYVPGEVPGSKSGDERSDESGLTRFQKHWEDASVQARSTAKWIATIIGAALGALIGTAPLSGLQGKQIPESAIIAAALGLVLIATTLFLVLRVLVPSVTGFGDIIRPRKLPRWSKFYHLQVQASRGGGVMLPPGISSLAELGWRTQIENQTLDKVAEKMKEASEDLAPGLGALKSAAQLGALKEALEIRGRWCAYLTEEVTGWTSIASYIVVKRAAGVARFWGLLFGVIGTALIVWAFLQPHSQVQPSPLSTFHIINTPGSSARDLAQTALGMNCRSFEGVVTAANPSRQTVTVLVKPSDDCAGISITLPIANLGNGFAPAEPAHASGS